ncbi:MAG: molybdopterin molybdotransferase MoeA [Clostridia bacterium]|nr:molybdopterin molybdotransferase MoeA [Clostridia bacterium]
MKEHLDYVTARDMLLDRVRPVGTERVPLENCYGRVLAHDLTAPEDVPPFDRSPYDGYAFRAEDTSHASPDDPVTLRLLEEIPAGNVPTKAVTEGTAVKILTGAPIPEGANAVRMKEKTVFTDETVTLDAPARPGENIIRTGEDMKKGDLIARRGTRIDAGLMGTLAAQGGARPEVYRRLRVGIISTGSEVTEADAPAAPGMIRNSNRYTLTAALLKEGMAPEYLGLTGDDRDAIAALIKFGAARCDAVLLTGGVSVGDHDLTPAAMETAGCETLFRGLAIKPGMACAYGLLDGKPVCGLSGNPASALTNFYLAALPALRAMAGLNEPVPHPVTLILRSAFKKKSPATRLLRGRLDLSDGRAGLILQGDQGNVVLSSTIGCDAMAIVPAGSGPLEEGTELKGFLI